MKNSLNVEAEGGELVIRNKNNDYAIIPKEMRSEVLNLMKKGCYDCIDKIVNTLPTANNYAEDGTIIPFKTGADVPSKNTLTNSAMQPIKTNTVTPKKSINSDVLFPNTTVPVDNTKVVDDSPFIMEQIKQLREQKKYTENADKYKVKDNNISIDKISNLESLDATQIENIQKELINKGYLKSTPITIDKSDKLQVENLQKKLIEKGYNLGKYGKNKDGVDGAYGKLTDVAFKEYEKNKEADGILGNKTRQAFRDYKLGKESSENKLDVDLKGKTEIEIQQELSKKNYFRNKKEDFDFNTENIMMISEKSGFKPSSETICTDKRCTVFVGQEIEKVIKEEGRKRIDAYGDAWTIRDRLINKGAKSIYNVFPKEKPKVSNPDKYIEQITRNKPNLKPEDFQSGDIINLYYGGSDYANQAYNEGSSVFSTHTGIIKIDSKGNKFIDHNVHGNIKKEPLSIFLENTAKTGSGKPLRITAVTRPNYNIKQYEDVYEPTETAINFDVVTNAKTPLGKKESAQFTQTLINNRDKILKDIPINTNEYNNLVKAARILGWKESAFQAQPKKEWKDKASNVREVLGGRESSKGFTLMKDEEIITPEIRNNLGINNESLKDPKVSAIATMYALSTKYLKIKSSLKDKNYTEDEFTQLAIISWNEPVDKVIKTAEKYGTLDKVIKAYKDDYGYNSKGETFFPSNLPVIGYNKYLKDKINS